MFRTVLVHVDSLKGSAARIALAIDLARQFDATLIGLTAGLPRLPIEVYDAALGTVAIGPDTYTEFDRRHVEAEFGKAEAAFKKATDGAGLEISWRAVFEAPSQAVVAAAVAADIVVVGPGDRSLLGDLAAASAGDIVLRTGRPVLVVGGQDRIAARNVLVAWKDGPEAQRAVADAVPFMKRAASVVVAAVHEGSDRPPGLDDAIAFLLRHGIAAKANVIAPKGLTIDEVILDLARRSQTDLIVAGAYGHSRLREWAFGGVTRALLTESPVPCLLSH